MNFSKLVVLSVLLTQIASMATAAPVNTKVAVAKVGAGAALAASLGMLSILSLKEAGKSAKAVYSLPLSHSLSSVGTMGLYSGVSCLAAVSSIAIVKNWIYKNSKAILSEEATN